jgi:DNA-damage-inducible protein D
MNQENALVVFQGNNIRRIFHNNKWYFSIIDIVGILTESSIPKRYWSDLKKKLKEEGFEMYENIVQLKFVAQDCKHYSTDCANTESMFRIIQSVPSKKAEPFKRWLAKVGKERIDEIENPELGQDRIKEYYELKGYPKDWIDKRLRGIAIRQELTDEWKNRDVNEDKEFAILTNEISKATFGKTVKEYKKFKSLKRPNQNIRDHMTDWELILNMFGEKATTDITKKEDSQGFSECKTSAKKGGNIAKRARKDLEKNIGKSIVSKNNFLGFINKKRLRHKKK